jgi:hypothetical protein
MSICVLNRFARGAPPPRQACFVKLQAHAVGADAGEIALLHLLQNAARTASTLAYPVITQSNPELAVKSHALYRLTEIPED